MDIDSSDDDGMFLTQSTYTTQYSDISSDETADKVIVGVVLEGFGDKITHSDDELVASCIVAEKQSTYETTYETDKKGGSTSETSVTHSGSRFHEPVPDNIVNDLQTKKFVCEVKKTDGTDFPSDTLYGLVICLRLHMDSIGKAYKFLTDDAFLQIKNTLDNMIKRRAKDPSSKPPIQAEVITPEEEGVLWAKGVIGSDNPKQLLDTIFYLIGINFALRGGQEHRNLHVGRTSHFSLWSDQHGCVLIYTGDVLSKSNQGGLKHRKCKAKSVRAYENVDKPERCLVEYLTHRPPPKTDSDPFYLRPFRKPMGDVWYSSQAVGRHSLAATVSDICQRAGLTGHRTNHSLRATAATRLFEADVDEQLICEVTGHRSSAVRSYKRTNSKKEVEFSSARSSFSSWVSQFYRLF